MQTSPFGLKLLAVVAASILAFGIFQACSNIAHGQEKAGPVGISFQVTEPVKATAEQKDDFVKAFDQFTDPHTTIVKDARAGVIWPPKGTKIKTEQVVTADAGDVRPLGNLMIIRSTQHTRTLMAIRSPQFNAWTSNAWAMQHTYMPPHQFTGSVRSTQFLGFKSEADMKAFVSAVSAK